MYLKSSVTSPKHYVWYIYLTAFIYSIETLLQKRENVQLIFFICESELQLLEGLHCQAHTPLLWTSNSNYNLMGALPS